MKILFTGSTSFTGFWFIQALAKAGYQVIACFQRPLMSYEGIRMGRIGRVLEYCKPVFNCSFGQEQFLKLIKENHIDIYCHHAAEVTNYKDPNFDINKAVANNTYNLKTVLEILKAEGCSKIVLTGTVFEPNEGQGSDNLRAVSPYGLSKGMTSELFRFYCHQYGFTLGKFVIANPFGPFEEQRFTNYLIQTWKSGAPAIVSTPDYIRDNIHVSLLAKAYSHFVKSVDAKSGYIKYNPSGYVESQKDFAKRFALEMEPRLRRPCRLEYKEQTEYLEPRTRVNIDAVNALDLNWDEKQAWDELAGYYSS
jgi:nucleoside-diphosphate-sugar epimerase